VELRRPYALREFPKLSGRGACGRSPKRERSWSVQFSWDTPSHCLPAHISKRCWKPARGLRNFLDGQTYQRHSEYREGSFKRPLLRSKTKRKPRFPSVIKDQPAGGGGKRDWKNPSTPQFLESDVKNTKPLRWKFIEKNKYANEARDLLLRDSQAGRDMQLETPTRSAMLALKMY